MPGPSERPSLDHRVFPFRASIPQATLALILVLASSLLALASDTGLSGQEGHPRARFPLAVWAQPTGDPRLDGAVKRAVDDWNAVFRETLRLEAFAWTPERAAAQVTLAVEPPTSAKLMGETRVRANTAGVILLPVTIIVFEPAARGQTSQETLLYQIVAHELGHALGLEHVRDPRSLMCCVPGSVNFSDPAERQAYLEARRHPDVGSVRAQLAEHYGRLWRERN